MDFDWGYIEEYLPELLEAFRTTVVITLVASALALVLGLAIALGVRSRRWMVAKPIAWSSEFVRRTPLLVQLYFLFYGLPQIGITLTSLTAGVLGLAVHHATYMAETYRAGIDAVPRGQWDAATALDLPRTRVWTRIVLPQALPGTLAAQGNWVILMFKQSALLAAITVQELLSVAQEIGDQNLDYLEPFTVAALLYFVVSYPASVIVRVWERRLSNV